MMNGMKDQYGRNINYLRISITDRCNLRCRYCMPDEMTPVPVNQLLTYEEIVQICRAAAEMGISRLKVTGGEPLVRKDCALLVGMLKKIPGIRQVTMTTNGILLPQYLPQLLENGLDAVNVSLDTLCPKVYEAVTGKNSLLSVLDAVGQAVDAGMRVKVNSVLLKGVNDMEWRELARLTVRMPLDVRFIEMMPIGFGKYYEPVSNERLLKKLKQEYPGLEKDDRMHGNGPAVYYKIKGAMGSIGLISPVHGPFCSQCNRLRLTSQGMLKPCLAFADGVDLMPIVRSEAQTQTQMRLQKALRQAVCMKPRMHRFASPQEVTESRQMVQIGG